jgi:hypothetical protein
MALYIDCVVCIFIRIRFCGNRKLDQAFETSTAENKHRKSILGKTDSESTVSCSRSIFLQYIGG